VHSACFRGFSPVEIRGIVMDRMRAKFAILVAFSMATPAFADRLSFRNDVLPVLGKAGCSNGSCHAKSGGQNGFQLSVFAYDPAADYRNIVRGARGRRIFPAAPEESLLLLKATQSIDHEGGKRFDKDSEFYRMIHKWISQGAPWNSEKEISLMRIEVSPSSGQYKRKGETSLKVTAHYSDKSKRDVTHLSEYQSNDQALAEVDHHGHVTMGNQFGEGVVIVRYMDKVEVARVAIPTETLLPESAYAKLTVNNEIDRKVYDRHKQLGLLVSDLASDSEFIRRASLDTLGKLPEPERVRKFLASKHPKKREYLIDELLDDRDWADHWATSFGDLVRPNTLRVGVKGVYLMDRWLRRKLRDNAPYDQIVREILTATGSTHMHGPTVLMRDKRVPADAGAFTSRIFLGVRLECAQCHHHPSEKWGQEDYYQLAAFFGSMKRKGQGISTPISGEPEYWYWQAGGTVKHPVSGEVMKPKPPDGPFIDVPKDQDPRAALVDWMVDPENPFFARALVNRLWGKFFGVGIVEPVDDFRASNPPTNEPLLDWLAKDFKKHKYDLKRTMRVIMNSRIYQTSSVANKTNVGDERNYARSIRRRLGAEAMSDAVTRVTGMPDTLEGLAKGTRAMMTWNTKMRSVFLDTFGRPDSSAECPCERDPSPTIIQSLHLMNSDKLEARIVSGSGRAVNLAKSERKPEEIADEIYLSAYSRFPTADEKKIVLAAYDAKDASREKVTQDLIWALINTPEFVLNH
tara:strand:- start:4787 stop:7021 length:2235 start_codon:yes stop_codon:yes gene_type:complete